ncbi:T-box transcription factor TBX22 isoform X3 [Melanerpes formicivorus]|uniref:T-box transcription factor TBX22 isoform X3 n=1 Tax=Melanerpes formicivorus TaxID=211600 RepID=UPI00358ED4BA
MALSSRAHAFSVEALVGRSAKRKVPDAQDEEPGAGCRQSRGAPETEKRPKAGVESREAGAGVQVELQGSELWRRFHEIGTEMIITKAGRRMFPSVRVKVKGLEPLKQYYIAIDVVPVDSKRYRYVYHSSQWMVAGNTDHSCITPRLYIHPDSPCSGETWMRQIISFDRVKLTNNEMDDKGHIILQSMHKYKPRVHVIAQDSRFDLAQIQSLPAEGVQTFSFQETEFTTVTAYQNQQITKLKIDRNPFAKGFRDPGRNRWELQFFTGDLQRWDTLSSQPPALSTVLTSYISLVSEQPRCVVPRDLPTQPQPAPLLQDLPYKPPETTTSPLPKPRKARRHQPTSFPSLDGGGTKTLFPWHNQPEKC